MRVQARRKAFDVKGYWLTPIPSLTPVKPNLMRLDDPVCWVDAAGKYFVVPTGFITDGASLPWLVTAIWDRWEPKTLRSSILHDYGYSTKSMGTKKQVDKRFLQGLQADKWPHALAYYRAVRFAGWYAWEIQRNVEQSS